MIEELTNRLLSQGRENRPLLKGKTNKQVKDFMETKLKERSPYYDQAKIVFSTDVLSPEEVYDALNKKGII